MGTQDKKIDFDKMYRDILWYGYIGQFWGRNGIIRADQDLQTYVNAEDFKDFWTGKIG